MFKVNNIYGQIKQLKLDFQEIEKGEKMATGLELSK
tara:strand:- start:2011 stop:2118 length:108 start_codon:yes stop_codon:yes gene_type:complete